LHIRPPGDRARTPSEDAAWIFHALGGERGSDLVGAALEQRSPEFRGTGAEARIGTSENRNQQSRKH
ncbi:hypothetical protein, partial [Escherichia coli]|uniref:hypothetical protein n=1 Tax=Escherichia coli TaxID=562 RepID=UPI0013D7420D